MAQVVNGMKDCNNFLGLVSIRRFHDVLDVSSIPKTQTLDAFLNKRERITPPVEKVAFHDSFLVCYSSGTTGIPKAIVHSVGGVLLNFVKEGRLHEDAKPDAVSLQYTTTGWIMYPASVGQLIFGARVLLYDGSPFQPDLQTFVKLIGDQKVTRLGISPRWMYELAKAGVSPRDITDLSSLRTVTSTGMVLSNQLFEWFYDKGFPSNVHLANISGGTDIVSANILFVRFASLISFHRQAVSHREIPSHRYTLEAPKVHPLASTCNFMTRYCLQVPEKPFRTERQANL
jgi:acetoacetyl-CoA synthetase